MVDWVFYIERNNLSSPLFITLDSLMFVVPANFGNRSTCLGYPHFIILIPPEGDGGIAKKTHSWLVARTHCLLTWTMSRAVSAEEDGN